LPQFGVENLLNFDEMNMNIFRMFTDKGFQDVSDACSSDKVSI
jgi:hypothetical protein